MAWIDTLAKGRRMGRSVVTRGRFATLDELPEKRKADPLKYHGVDQGDRAPTSSRRGC